jgi:hypothetical protein
MSKECRKDEFLEHKLTGIRDKNAFENRQLIYKNDEP